MLVMIETHDNDFSGEIAEALKYILADTIIKKWNDKLLKQIGRILAAKRAIEGEKGLYVKNACENSTIYTDLKTIAGRLKVYAKSEFAILVDRVTEDLPFFFVNEPRFFGYIQIACENNCETILIDTSAREYVLI